MSLQKSSRQHLRRVGRFSAFAFALVAALFSLSAMAQTSSPNRVVVSSGEGSGTLNVTLGLQTAQWKASAYSNANWLTVTPTNGTGDATLTYTYTANTSDRARIGTITAAGRKFSVTQRGITGAYTPWKTNFFNEIVTVADTACFIGSGGDKGCYDPTNIAVDGAANVFFTYAASPNQNTVWRVDSSSGAVTPVSGDPNQTAGFSGDGGPATAARLNGPSGLAVDPSGNLYIGDARNYRVRKVDAKTGNITTVAGNGTPGFSGDGGLATSAQLSTVGGMRQLDLGLTLDSSGNLYIADSGNGRIRRVDAQTGIINTIAGGIIGGDASLFDVVPLPPLSVSLWTTDRISIDSQDNVYLVPEGQLVRMSKATGLISLVGPGRAFYIYFGGNDMSADLDSNVYVAEKNCPTSDMHGKLQRINAGDAAVWTVAGDECDIGTDNDGVPAVIAQVRNAWAMASDSAGNPYITQSPYSTHAQPPYVLNAGRIRFVDFVSPGTAVSPPAANVMQFAGTASVKPIVMVNPPTSGWTASSNDAWLTVTTPSGNSGDFVNYSFTANNDFAPRSGTITVNDQPFTLNQAAGTVTFNPSPLNIPFGGSSGTVAITVTPSAANWIASSTAPWLTVSPPSGHGNATLTYQVAANSDSVDSRAANIRVGSMSAWKGLLVQQNGVTAVLSQSNLAFAMQIVGKASVAKQVMLSSTTQPVSISNISIEGSNPQDFTQTTTCGSSLIAGANCAINVVFAPKAYGTRRAVVTLSTTASGVATPMSFAVSGTGDISLIVSRAVRPSRTNVISNSSNTVVLNLEGTLAEPVHLSCELLTSGQTCNFDAQDFRLTGSRDVTLSVKQSAIRSMRLQQARPADAHDVRVVLSSGDFRKTITVPASKLL